MASPPAPPAPPGSGVPVLALLGPLLLVVLGCGGMVVVLHGRADTTPFADGVETTGVVVAVEPTGDHGDTFRATSRFVDQDGASHEVTGPSGGDEPQVGDTIRVSYPPDAPDRARDLTTNHDAWRFPFGTCVFLVGLGVVLEAGVVALLWWRRRHPSDHGRAP